MDKGKESSKEIRSRILSVSAIVGIIALVAGGIGGFLIHRGINGLDPDEQKLVDEYRTLKDEWLFGNEEEFLADKFGAEYAEFKKRVPQLIPYPRGGFPDKSPNEKPFDSKRAREEEIYSIRVNIIVTIVIVVRLFLF